MQYMYVTCSVHVRYMYQKVSSRFRCTGGPALHRIDFGKSVLATETDNTHDYFVRARRLSLPSLPESPSLPGSRLIMPPFPPSSLAS